MGNLSSVESLLEWESFNWDLIITNIISLNNCYKIPSTSKITVSRDSEYKLIGELSFDGYKEFDLKYKINNTTPGIGEILIPDVITGNDLKNTRSFKLKNFYIGPINQNYKVTRAEFTISEIEEQFTERETNTLLEFYLSGNLGLQFPRTSIRSINENLSKIRYLIDDDSAPNNIISTGYSRSNDHFFVETDNFNFIVQKVYKDHLPEWANGIQIEYRKAFKSIPDQETREAVSEIISFILGTHLMKIGESHFDAESHIVKRIALTPWGDNIISKTKSFSRPPVKSNSIFDLAMVERLLNKLVPRYLMKRETLGLKDIMWKYWISKELAIGVNLPILSCALESLAENYIGTNNIITKYSKEQKTEYYDLIETDVKAISEKLINYDFRNRVINSIKNPFEIGIGQKLKLFLNHLGINIANDSIENKALLARNKMVHSTIELSEGSIETYIKLSSAYITFMNRILLKIMDYDGAYIDYYSTGFPEKSINDNI